MVVAMTFWNLYDDQKCNNQSPHVFGGRGVTLKPEFRTTGQETLSLNSVLATAAKVSGLWQFDCVISWLISVLMSTLQAPICSKFLIAVEFLELGQQPVASRESTHHTTYSLPGLGGVWRNVGTVCVALHGAWLTVSSPQILKHFALPPLTLPGTREFSKFDKRYF